MTKREFKKVIERFHFEFDSWYNRLLRENNGNYEVVTTEICQIMHDKFHTPTKSLNNLAINLTPETIEETIVELSKEGNYVFTKQTPSTIFKDEFSDEWILRKKHGTRELTLRLSNENYIYLQGNYWNLNAYSFKTLRNAILCWADNTM